MPTARPSFPRRAFDKFEPSPGMSSSGWGCFPGQNDFLRTPRPFRHRDQQRRAPNGPWIWPQAIVVGSNGQLARLFLSLCWTRPPAAHLGCCPGSVWRNNPAVFAILLAHSHFRLRIPEFQARHSSNSGLFRRTASFAPPPLISWAAQGQRVQICMTINVIDMLPRTPACCGATNPNLFFATTTLFFPCPRREGPALFCSCTGLKK